MRSASCSIAPDSRKSLSCGRWSFRLSRARFSCESAMTGQSSSRASSLSDARDRGDLLLAVLRARDVHELEVVDDDEVEPPDARLHAPGLRADEHRRDRGRRVDVERQPVERVGGAVEPRVIGLGHRPAAEPARVDALGRREHVRQDLVLAHLEAEEQDARAVLAARVQRAVERERRLAHRRPRREDHEVAPLEPAGHARRACRSSCRLR